MEGSTDTQSTRSTGFNQIFIGWKVKSERISYKHLQVSPYINIYIKVII